MDIIRVPKDGLMMSKSEAVARYLVHLSLHDREPVPLTQMHVQKLLYFVQGWCLATRGTPLFLDDFRALPHGPVITNLARVFKKFGKSAIPLEEAANGDALASSDRDLVRSVWRKYRSSSAYALRAKTHAQAPWSEAWQRRMPRPAPYPLIEKSQIKDFFNREFDAFCAKRSIEPDRLRESLAQAERGELMDFDEVVSRGRTG